MLITMLWMTSVFALHGTNKEPHELKLGTASVASEASSLCDERKFVVRQPHSRLQRVKAEHLTAVPATFSKIAVSYGYTATYQKIEDL